MRFSYIPQAWLKFYEFSESDLRMARSCLDNMLSRKQANQVENNNFDWTGFHGLLDQAIYGGRIDNEHDLVSIYS